MSHNENTPERSARRHSPALIAIVAALLLAGIAALVFGWMNGRPEPVGEHAPASDAVSTMTPGATPAATDAAVPAAPATTTPPATTAPPATTTGPAATTPAASN